MDSVRMDWTLEQESVRACLSELDKCCVTVITLLDDDADLSESERIFLQQHLAIMRSMYDA